MPGPMSNHMMVDTGSKFGQDKGVRFFLTKIVSTVHAETYRKVYRIYSLFFQDSRMFDLYGSFSSK